MPIHLSKEDSKKMKVKAEYLEDEGRIEWTYNRLKEFAMRGLGVYLPMDPNEYAIKHFYFIDQE